MENNERDTAQNAAQENDWQNAETSGSLNADPAQYSGASADNIARTTEEVDDRLYATERDKEDEDDIEEDDLEEDEDEEEEDEDEDDTEEEEEDKTGDWGHVDPAESNDPFPDPNAPSAPGSAV